VDSTTRVATTDRSTESNQIDTSTKVITSEATDSTTQIVKEKIKHTPYSSSDTTVETPTTEMEDPKDKVEKSSSSKPSASLEDPTTQSSQRGANQMRTASIKSNKGTMLAYREGKSTPTIVDSTTRVATTDRSTESNQIDTSTKVITSEATDSTTQIATTNRVTSGVLYDQKIASQQESTTTVSSTADPQETESDNVDNLATELPKTTNIDYLQYTTDKDVTTVQTLVQDKEDETKLTVDEVKIEGMSPNTTNSSMTEDEDEIDSTKRTRQRKHQRNKQAMLQRQTSTTSPSATTREERIQDNADKDETKMTADEVKTEGMLPNTTNSSMTADEDEMDSTRRPKRRKHRRNKQGMPMRQTSTTPSTATTREERIPDIAEKDETNADEVKTEGMLPNTRNSFMTEEDNEDENASTRIPRPRQYFRAMPQRQTRTTPSSVKTREEKMSKRRKDSPDPRLTSRTDKIPKSSESHEFGEREVDTPRQTKDRRREQAHSWERKNHTRVRKSKRRVVKAEENQLFPTDDTRRELRQHGASQRNLNRHKHSHGHNKQAEANGDIRTSREKKTKHHPYFFHRNNKNIQRSHSI